jgi:hypothetical protein
LHFREIDDWNKGQWDFKGVEVMRDYFDKHRERMLDSGYDLSEGDAEQKLTEISEQYAPSQLVAYPVIGDLSDDKIAEICLNTECTVVKDTEKDQYYLSHTGGGMDLSQELAMGYMIARGRIPPEVAHSVSTQYGLNLKGEKWMAVAKQCKTELEIAAKRYQMKIEEWEEGIAEYKKEKGE